MSATSKSAAAAMRREIKKQAAQTKRLAKVTKSYAKKAPPRPKKPVSYRGRVQFSTRPLPQHGVSGSMVFPAASDMNQGFNPQSLPLPILNMGGYNTTFSGTPEGAIHSNNDYISSRGIAPNSYTQTGEDHTPFSQNVDPQQPPSVARDLMNRINQGLERALMLVRTPVERRQAQSFMDGEFEAESKLDSAVQHGFTARDPLLTANIHDSNVDSNAPNSQYSTPLQNRGPNVITPSTRQTAGVFESPTDNLVEEGGAAHVTTGNSSHPILSDRTTPAARPTGNVSVAVHPSQTGPEGANVPFDGSWVFDITQNEAPLSLRDLPPAAELPVRSYGPGPMTVRTAQFSRPAGNVRLGQHYQAV